MGLAGDHSGAVGWHGKAAYLMGTYNTARG